MKYDIFFSVSQTPVDGRTPSEAEMFRHFFDQVRCADELGFDTAWVAEAHLSTEVQKSHEKPVVPHWQGEIGLNCDIFQLAHRVFAQTKQIEVGSAVMNLLSNGGPLAAAERVAFFGALHGIDDGERRRLHVGFSAGRFDFMNRAYGVVPRNALENAAWMVVRGKVFAEAADIFLRLLRGDVVEGEAGTGGFELTRGDFRSDEDWAKVQLAAGEVKERYSIPRRYVFEPVKIIPADWRRELVQPVLGSHDPQLQVALNEVSPVQVFNLSITAPEVIDQTHARMAEAYHRDGGEWRRDYMPRTVFVFLNDEAGLDAGTRSARAKDEAQAALGAYWKALEGTLDPAKVERAANNALIGNADEVAAQIVERFHSDDRLMLWFDFFNHDNERVMRNMRAFRERVIPAVEERAKS